MSCNLHNIKPASKLGDYFLGAKNIKQKYNNRAILTISQMIKNVMASASEVERESIFINVREAILLRTTVEEMGNPQSATTMKLDNST